MGNCLRNRRTALDSVLMSEESSHVAIGQNQLLRTCPETWTSEVPLTEGQLRGRRDTFWETAPAYDGRREIWDALKAACEAVQEGDYGLAQAIVDGANISLPTGRLVEAYDELGNRYVVPKYCISRATNMVGMNLSTQRPAQAENEDSNEIDSSTNLLQEASTPTPSSGASAGLRSRVNAKNRRSRSKSKSKGGKQSSGHGREDSPPLFGTESVPVGEPMVIKVRVSTLPKDIKMTLQASDKVRDIKQRLEAEQGVAASRVTMLYSGRVLNDRTYVKNLAIPKGFLIQAIVT